MSDPKVSIEYPNCLRGGCADGHVSKSNCQYCGFDVDEDERRKALPLVKGEDGLYRKNVYVPGKPAPQYRYESEMVVPECREATYE